ncbi:MAG: polysaccharide biosynthesis protein [Hyphomonadaceae bacterium]|nr:polysaccharide biosynthesis protein [Hyphomonadaceae bacterium]
MKPEVEAKRAMALTLGFDVAAAFFAMLIAIFIRWSATEGAPPDAWVAALFASGAFAVAASISFFLMRVHRQVWRHSGWPDASRIIQAVALTALVFLPLLFVWNRLVGFPRSSLALALLIWVTIIFLGRMVALSRSTRRPFQIFRGIRADAPPAILVANAHEAADVLRDLQATSGGAPVRILGLIEADGAEPGRAIRGVPVFGGLNELGKMLDLLGVRYNASPWVAVAGTVRERETMNAVLETATQHGSEVMALGADREGLHLQRVRPADLLARPVRKLDTAPLKALLEGKRIFVTGAGGTIGSQLVKQCADLGAAHLTLFDASEFNLYEIDLTLRELHPTLDISAQIGDVRDKNRLRQAVLSAQPDIMIHAAALKHVPLMELNSCEAILTNVGGTINAADIAIECGLERFVFISTDKAVDPDNVMGATKRLAELALAYRVKGTHLAVSMVRFGNVLGSSGSVVPLFERQIAAGGPLTLTDDQVSRYFMTVEEAASLVLQGAAHNGSPGEASLYVLDMGDPIRIRTLAESMIRMKGMVPYQDIKIKTTGLRPGEKLHEELTYANERLIETGIGGLNKVAPRSRKQEPVGFSARIEKLLSVAGDRQQDEALVLLGQLVPAYTPPVSDADVMRAS